MDLRDSLLLVTSDAELAEALTSIFSEMYECFIATNCEEAVDRAKQNEISLALIDDVVKDKSCIEISQEIVKANEEVAVIVILTEDDINGALQAHQLGVYDFITKPLDLSKIEIRIQVALQRREKELAEKEYKSALESRVNVRSQEAWTSKEKLRQQLIAMIRALEKTLQARHVYTEGHSRRVAHKSAELAQLMGLSKEQQDIVELAALFHDIGKIGIRDEVLNKAGRLTDSEYEHMKIHPLVAEQILKPITELQPVADIIKHEHERFDGHGYPEGLQGDEIPLGARIISIVDAWDSMVYDRIYRKAFPKEEAIQEIERCGGTQFDPKIVRVFADNERQKLRELQAEK